MSAISTTHGKSTPKSITAAWARYRPVERNTAWTSRRVESGHQGVAVRAIAQNPGPNDRIAIQDPPSFSI